jgi:biotin carboxyl carrier protein
VPRNSSFRIFCRRPQARGQFSQIGPESGVFEAQVTRKFAGRKPFVKHDPGIVKAVISGVVTEISTRPGSIVKKADTGMVLEAMKMLNRIMAPRDGTVKAIRVSAGDKVVKGQVLIEIT